MLKWFTRLFTKPMPASHEAPDAPATDEREGDVTDLLEALLRRAGHVPERVGARIHLGALSIETEFLEMNPGGKLLRTSTQIAARHAAFGEAPVVEFQHGFGETTEAALTHGYERWMTTDLITLLEAPLEEATQCMRMEMTLPANDVRGPLTRRLVFGPVEQTAANAPPQACGVEGDHEFCPCCLFMRSVEVFKPLLEEDNFYALRLFASRGPHGDFNADCRVNAQEYPAGVERLLAYAATWPGTGFLLRKQYVIIRTTHAASAEANA